MSHNKLYLLAHANVALNDLQLQLCQQANSRWRQPSLLQGQASC
jgi:hypothetical protein